MRKSRGEKVFEAGTRQGRVRTIRRGGTRAEKFFRRRRYTRMGTRFLKRVSATSFERLASTPSSPCHATLSVVGRDALFQRWSIEDRATKTVFSSKRMFLFFFIHQFSSSDEFLQIYLSFWRLVTQYRDFLNFLIVLNILIKSETICIT